MVTLLIAHVILVYQCPLDSIGLMRGSRVLSEGGQTLTSFFFC